MLLPIVALVIGLAVLVWSADKFIEGAAGTSKILGVSPLIIGMIVIGFGTSAPEMVVSAFAASSGNPGLALGNAYGSNITNIGLVLGLSAALLPMTVSSGVLRKEIPLLIAVTLLAGYQILDGTISRLDAVVLLVAFVAVMLWMVLQQKNEDIIGTDTDKELEAHPLSLKMAIVWLLVGLVLLIISSRVLVWGAVEIATAFGVDDLIIGLTIVALGTSLPELAAAMVAIRKQEHDLALGNLIGSNLFNTLAVVGIAGAIEPISVAAEVLLRDWTLMLALTLIMAAFSWRPQSWQPQRPARINRIEGSAFVAIYLGYIGWLVFSVIQANSLT
ncbi:MULTISPECIES: calcium/sodium antiporter [Gammaproteobacteria]|uniref:calcium/sodium antiporter n=1 Tax=Gammaproteobacteria TaxID=1236 RepID=UPI000DCFEFA3|nr:MULTISPECIES: calcium/sodium antiporter [Gammaproteobacteria]RTE87732.1 calcium/sodium antiporter [Aliidiomarina sp. B3213]TCZ92486.1 calcium/sodium antiporter [Lysobacter sp. N42]